MPGVVVMNAVSASMWAGMGTIDEIERGTLNRFLITPMRRAAILNANVIVQAVSTGIQSLIIVLLGWAAGAHYPGGSAGPVVLVVASILLGTVFSALSNVLGMTVRQRESIIGLSIFLLLPLTFLSTAFMAKSADARLDAGRRLGQSGQLGARQPPAAPSAERRLGHPAGARRLPGRPGGPWSGCPPSPSAATSAPSDPGAPVGSST